MRHWQSFLGLIVVACTTPALADDDRHHRKAADDIAQRINAYRLSVGLPAVSRSEALDAVAQAHVADLAANCPDRGTDARGRPCNLHSWSRRGPWSPVCYTADHAYSTGMWNKPAELTRGAYQGIGVEIATKSPAGVSAKEAVAGWKSSPAHQTVIVERGAWANFRWQAMGVAAGGDYAIVWFGAQPDRTRFSFDQNRPAVASRRSR